MKIKKRIIFFLTIIISIYFFLMPKSFATNIKSGRTILNYTDVNLKAIDGNKIKILVENPQEVNLDKIVLTDGTKTISESKNSYIEYAGTGVFQLEFYKKDAKIPFTTKNVEIKQNTKNNTYSANFSPSIVYEKKGLKEKYLTLKIVDGNQEKNIKNGSQVKELTIYRKNDKEEYDYKEANIIYKLNANNATMTDTKYINSINIKNRKKITIKINRLEEYGYYMIVAKDNYGMTHRREVKVPSLKVVPITSAQVENTFAPNISLNKKGANVIFNIKNAEKENVTFAGIYAIKNGKISNENLINNDQAQIIIKGGYIDSIRFNKEGNFRLELKNDKGNKYYSDYIIKKKFNSSTWVINETPRVTKHKLHKKYQSVKVKDSEIDTIKIYLKENGKYDKQIYNYKNTKSLAKENVLSADAKYIQGTANGSQNKKNIYIGLYRLNENTNYKIEVTDKTGLKREKFVVVPKLAKEVKKVDNNQKVSKDKKEKKEENNKKQNNNSTNDKKDKSSKKKTKTTKKNQKKKTSKTKKTTKKVQKKETSKTKKTTKKAKKKETPKTKKTTTKTQDKKVAKKNKSSISFNKQSIKLKVGETKTLKPKVSPKSANITWSTSDSKVAIVKNGKVTGKKKGSATITAKIDGAKAKIKVIVENKKKVKKKVKKEQSNNIKSQFNITKDKQGVDINISIYDENGINYISILEGESYCKSIRKYGNFGTIDLESNKKGKVKILVGDKLGNKQTKTVNINSKSKNNNGNKKNKVNSKKKEEKYHIAKYKLEGNKIIITDRDMISSVSVSSGQKYIKGNVFYDNTRINAYLTTKKPSFFSRSKKDIIVIKAKDKKGNKYTFKIPVKDLWFYK